MADEFAPMNLRARLAALQDRIAQARAQLEAHGVTGDQADALTDFVDQHDAIRSSLDARGHDNRVAARQGIGTDRRTRERPDPMARQRRKHIQQPAAAQTERVVALCGKFDAHHTKSATQNSLDTAGGDRRRRQLHCGNPFHWAPRRSLPHFRQLLFCGSLSNALFAALPERGEFDVGKLFALVLEHPRAFSEVDERTVAVGRDLAAVRVDELLQLRRIVRRDPAREFDRAIAPVSPARRTRSRRAIADTSNCSCPTTPRICRPPAIGVNTCTIPSSARSSSARLSCLAFIAS